MIHQFKAFKITRIIHDIREGNLSKCFQEKIENAKRVQNSLSEERSKLQLRCRQELVTMSYALYLADEGVRRPQIVANPLLRKIQRACRMSLSEPDIAANLDISDYINEKQGATSRDAVITLVKLINNRDTRTAILALALLDVLVKNCGYPVHLQISRKEFLNELVKRFPEQPPLRYSKVQKLILTAIEEWYQTICKHSNYKEDLGYIRDMHRLLKYKGYIFPKIKEEDLAVLRPTQQLKTVAEMRKEQEIKQAAKLEELIRRGKPDDLKEANKLMKVMAGFKQDNDVQIKQSISQEINKLKRKADILNDMLSSGNTTDNETMNGLCVALKVAQPKFQSIISEEQEDDQMVQDLLKFNDFVNQLLEKYNSLNGIVSDNNNSNSVNSGGALAHEINLIDFDDLSTPQSQTELAEPSTSNTESTNHNNSNNSNSNVDLLGDLLGDMQLSNNKLPHIGLGDSVTISSPRPAEPVITTNNKDLLGFDNLTNTNPNEFTPDLLNDLGPGSLSKPADKSKDSHLITQSQHIRVEAVILRESDSSIRLHFTYSNVGAELLTNIEFQIAVPKTLTLRLQPQSSNVLEPLSNTSITQDAFIDNVLINAVKPLKIKWKLIYNINGQIMEDTAIYSVPKI